MTFRSRSLTGTVAAATLVLTVSACGGDASPDDSPGASGDRTPQVTSTPTATPTATPAGDPQGTVIDVRIGGSQPEVRRVKIEVGEKVVLRITATKAGSLHVHSSPEQEIDFPAGTTEVTLVIDQPGIVDVEDHDSDTLLVQLEVR